MKNMMKLFLALMMMCTLVTPKEINAIESQDSYSKEEIQSYSNETVEVSNKTSVNHENEIHEGFSVLEEPKVYLSSTSVDTKATSKYSYKNENELLQILIDKSREALLNGTNKIDLTPYKMNDKTTSIGSGYNYFIPYVCDGIELIMYVDSQGYFTEFKFKNPKSIKETKNHIRYIDEEIAYLKTIVSKDYSDEKNALVLHDHLVDQYAYDETFNYENCAYFGGVLLHKEAICQSYSYIYKYILSTVGIDSYYITSAALNHAWNIVDIDGTYYHVDVTWDDPITDRMGGVNHSNFLLSDNGIKNSGHTSWENKGFVCTSTKYDNYYWKDVRSAIVNVGNYYYYAKNNQFVRADAKGNVNKVIRELGSWPTGDGYVWGATYSGAFKNGNYIYYNTPTTICRYNYNTQKDEACYKVNDSRSILGIRNRNDVVQVFLGYNPYNGTGVIYNTYQYLEAERAKISGITVSKDEYVINIGEEAFFYVTAYPMYASYENISWKIADSSIAGFSSTTGNIIGNKAGTTTITITADNGISKTVKVRVRKALPFTDVSKYAWYRETVEEVYDLGLMSGATSTLFKPDSKMNRAMVACVFHRMEGSPKTTYVKKFSDVPSGQYYSSPVTWAANKKIINGYESGTFKPTKNITREEMVTMVANFAKYKGKYSKKTYDLNKFNDGKKVSAYAKESMQWAIVSGVISGKNNGTKLDPLGTASRAECSKMLLKVYEMIY